MSWIRVSDRPLGILLFALATMAISQTAADRAKAGVGAPVKELTPAKDLSPKENKTREEQWRREIRQQLFIEEPLPALDAKTWSSFSPTPGVIAERVTYQTADGMLVPAIVYRPEKRDGKIPGIVVVNGHGGDKFSWYAFYSGMMFARAEHPCSRLEDHDVISRARRGENGSHCCDARQTRRGITGRLNPHWRRTRADI